MSGPVHVGWRHTRIVPPDARGIAARYYVQARKVLGFAEQEAKRTGLMTYQHVQRLDDGVVLVGEILGGEPRMTIDVRALTGPRPPITSPDAFVVWPRNALLPDGIDDEHPRLLLRPSWVTYFFDTEIAGYESFSRSKGTYIDLLPEGVRHAGNVDWIGKQGDRVSWYGPSSRYFHEPYIHAYRQFGKFVFQLGRVLLSMDDYLEALNDDSEDPGFDERWVLGAARLGTWLYVIHTTAYNLTSTPPPYQRRDGAVTDPVQATITADVVLSRFRLEGVFPFVNVLGDSRQELWRQTRPFPYQPWFFNASVTEAVCCELPASALYSMAPTPVYEHATQSNILTLTIGEESVDLTVQTTSLVNAPGQEAVLAVDYIEDERVELRVKSVLRTSRPSAPMDTASFALRWGDAEVLMFDPLWRQGTFPEVGYDTRYLAHADLRTGVLAFWRLQDWYLPYPEAAIARFEIWRGATLSSDEALPRAAADQPNDLGLYAMGLPRPTDSIPIASLAVLPQVAPMLVLIGIFAEPYRYEGGYTYFNIYFGGLCLGYPWQTRPVDEWWGYYKPARRFGGVITDPDPAIMVNATVAASPDNLQQDNDGNRSVLGCASNKDAVVLSVSLPATGGAFADPFAHYHVTGDTLPSLTGVSGACARYHPVWLLGQPPKT